MRQRTRGASDWDWERAASGENANVDEDEEDEHCTSERRGEACTSGRACVRSIIWLIGGAESESAHTQYRRKQLQAA